jgi:hypothetical protein
MVPSGWNDSIALDDLFEEKQVVAKAIATNTWLCQD